MKFLKKFRNDKKMTREQMAKLLEISVSLYDLVENGTRKPSGNFLTRFKRAFPSFDMNIFFKD